MSKQTSIEWLIEQLIPEDQHEGIMDIIEEAKAMHKEEISDAWYAGDEDGPIHDFEDYYQETYKKD